MTSRARRRRIESSLHENPRAVDVANVLPDVDDPVLIALMHEIGKILMGEVAPTHPMMMSLLRLVKGYFLGAIGVEPAKDSNDKVVISLALNLRGCEVADRAWGVGLSPGPGVTRQRMIIEDLDSDMAQFDQLIQATVTAAPPEAKGESKT